MNWHRTAEESLMDLALTDEQAGMWDLAKTFIDTEVVPHTRDWDRAEQVDRSIVGKLGKVGFLGVTIPEEYGGSGGDHISYALMMEELGRGDSAIRGIVSVSLCLVGKLNAGYGNQ